MLIGTYSETETKSRGEEIIQFSKHWQFHNFICFLKKALVFSTQSPYHLKKRDSFNQYKSIK